ncbi:MAG: ankyrin repeat domain-containing protein, partial [Rickettsiaceae bacterium]|nr:ankyrin repeat domain-containing protein [Rickettsiaceae bacterium]
KEQAYVESKAKYDSLKDSAKKEEINKNLIEILQKKPDNYNELIYLIAKGVDVNIRDSDGNTPLMLSAQNQGQGINYLKSIVRIIIKCGADINAVNNDGKTALDLAVHFTHHLKALGAKAGEGNNDEECDSDRDDAVAPRQSASSNQQEATEDSNQMQDKGTEEFAEGAEGDLINYMIEILQDEECDSDRDDAVATRQSASSNQQEATEDSNQRQDEDTEELPGAETKGDLPEELAGGAETERAQGDFDKCSDGDCIWTRCLFMFCN